MDVKFATEIPDNFSDTAKKLLGQINAIFMSQQDEKQLLVPEVITSGFHQITHAPGYTSHSLTTHGMLRDDTFVVPKNMIIYLTSRIGTRVTNAPLILQEALGEEINETIAQLPKEERFFFNEYIYTVLSPIEQLRSAIQDIKQNGISICYTHGSLCPNLTMKPFILGRESILISIQDPRRSKAPKNTQMFLKQRILTNKKDDVFNLAQIVQQQLPLREPHLLVLVACSVPGMHRPTYNLDCLGHFQYPIVDRDRNELTTIVTGEFRDASLKNHLYLGDFKALMSSVAENPDKTYHMHNILDHILPGKYYADNVLKLETPLRNFNFTIFRKAFLNTFKTAFNVIDAQQYETYAQMILSKDTIKTVTETFRRGLCIAVRFWFYHMYKFFTHCADTTNRVVILFTREQYLISFLNRFTTTTPGPSSSSSNSKQITNKFGARAGLTQKDVQEFHQNLKTMESAKVRFNNTPQPFLCIFNICLVIILFQCIVDHANPSSVHFSKSRLNEMIELSKNQESDVSQKNIRVKLIEILTELSHMMVEVRVPDPGKSKRKRSKKSQVKNTKLRRLM
jgi:hypothetical protein